MFEYRYSAPGVKLSVRCRYASARIWSNEITSSNDHPATASVPGQSRWYDVPSQSKSPGPKQPISWTRVDAAPSKQPVSSKSTVVSGGAGFVQLPPSPSIALQYSK